MMTISQVFLDSISIGVTTIRFLTYPFVIYSLIVLALTLDSWRNKRILALHILVTLIFLLLWAVNILKLFGYTYFIPYVNDYLFTPVLIILAILAWRKVLEIEHGRREKVCKEIFKRTSTVKEEG